MQTGVLSSLQLTAMFPATIVENFYVKTRNAIEDGRTKAPYGFVIPVQRDMTRAAELVSILRRQGIEVGQATAEFTIGDAKYPAGSYVIKRDQPYGRLAKNLLERQLYPGHPAQHLRRQRLDHGAADAGGREGDCRLRHPEGADDAGDECGGDRHRSPAAARRASPWRTTARTT